MKPIVATAVGAGLLLSVAVGGVVGWNANSAAPTASSPSSSTTSSIASSTTDTTDEESTPSPSIPDPGAPSGTMTPVLQGATSSTAVGIDARVSRVPRSQWREIVATGTWRPGCPAGRKDLRRIDLNYRTFQGTVARGQLVANKDSVDDLVEIFTELFAAGFPIARMEPVERYGGDVLRSLQANNTSAFNCRKPGQINAPVKDSPHANGRAIDINPVQNPWRDPRCTCWQPSKEFAKTKQGPGIIRKGSLPVELFEARGWVWQNIKVPDYMHFDTGYPSRPRASS